MSLDNIRALVTTELNDVNQLIMDDIAAQIGLMKDLSHHIVEQGGKRLRPILLLLSAKAMGYNGKKHILYAAAIEYFHTATLLHDDVLDESELRRGVETANQIWGSKASILVGDYLLTKSIQLMLNAKHLGILSILVDCAHQITCGEVKQLHNRGNIHLSINDYFDIIRSKTALLFQASSEIGAHLGNESDNDIKAMRAYGLHLGNAFQIIDDALDYDADSQTIGKTVGDDLSDCKLTLPLIHALRLATETEKQFITDSLKKGKRENLGEIQTILSRTKAIQKTYATAQEEIDKALSALQPIPNSEYKEALVSLAHFALERSY